jgi:hypothetical protein
MPTKREREYYQLGFRDGVAYAKKGPAAFGSFEYADPAERYLEPKPKRKRKLSAWNKYVKANSNKFVKQNSSKPRFRYARSGKLNLKKMAVAFRKTPAGKKKRR